MTNKHYTGTNTSQIKHLYPEWIYPDWMPPWEYREYQERRANSIRKESERVKRISKRHKAFLENAEKYGIPVSKTKKNEKRRKKRK